MSTIMQTAVPVDAVTPTPTAVIAVHDISVRRGNRRVLDGVSIAVVPGQVLAIVGASGGGKSTLLAALAGTQAIEQGSIITAPGAGIGVVPQDDIVHRDLPLGRTLKYAAQLRVAGSSVDESVERVLAELNLGEFATVRVADLSGGQRKRASIAVELFARPAVLLLDEPTAGLDPASAAALMATLRRLADDGCAVVVTTHQLADLEHADAVVALDGGRLVSVDGAEALVDVLGIRRITNAPALPDDRAVVRAVDHTGPARSSGWRQWRALTRRNVEVLARGRLTLAILLGAPLLVVAMFAVLFQPNTFGGAGPVDTAGQSMVAYWLAFAAFFFGLTYGLLQICTEIAVARRERYAGVGIGAYIVGKIAVLVPVLLLVDIALVMVLRVLDRIPSASIGTTVGLVTILLLDGIAALVLGLFLSALVTDTAQAAMALPMVCFPAVLFAGAIVPVIDMASAGRVISTVTPARWAFEAIAANLRVDLAGHTATAMTASLILAGFAIAFAASLRFALQRRL